MKVVYLSKFKNKKGRGKVSQLNSEKFCWKIRLKLFLGRQTIFFGGAMGPAWQLSCVFLLQQFL